MRTARRIGGGYSAEGKLGFARGCKPTVIENFGVRFEFALPITISMMMPIIPEPEGHKAFGGRIVVMFGGYNVKAVRRWQERVQAAKNDLVRHDDNAELRRGAHGDGFKN